MLKENYSRDLKVDRLTQPCMENIFTIFSLTAMINANISSKSIKTSIVLIVRSMVVPILFLLFSCEREITIDAVDVQQELVVNALIDPDGIDSLLLSSTFTTENEGVSGASVVVTRNGDTIGRYVEESKGFYCYEGETFQEKMDYGLSIHHPDYPNVSASTTVPVTPEFWFGTYAENGKKVKQFSREEMLISNANIQVLLEFEDDEKTNNYYFITSSSTYEYTLRVGFPEQRDSIVSHTEPAQLNSRSPLIEMTYSGSYYDFGQLSYDWETSYSVYEKGIIFSDKLFNGQIITIPVDLILPMYNNTTQVHLTLTAISEEYYQLIRSLATRERNGEGFFPEALKVYSNVHNGHGLWAAQSGKTVTLDISPLPF